MIQDIDVKAMKKNAFRVSKERGMTASRARSRRPGERQEHGAHC